MTVDRVVGLAAVVAALLLYLLPLLLAAKRDAPQLRRVVLVDVLLGWTVVGWLYYLALACRRAQLPAPARLASRWRDPSLQDRPPAWLIELPGQRAWHALPRDTAPLPLNTDPEQQ